MIYSFTTQDAAPVHTQVALHLMVNQLSASVLPSAAARENVLVNEISPALLVKTNVAKLTILIRRLLDTLVSNTRGNLIRLSAKIYGDVLLLHVKNRTEELSPELIASLIPVQELARELFGNVTITSHRNQVTTVALSFMNQPRQD